jgi:tetratricopeptide (TPR) repeat protein
MIFLSYRRADARFPATFLASRLKDIYGNDSVFIDFDDLPPGHPWPHHLETQLDMRRVVLVLVGKDWNTPRLRDPDDWVRREVCTGIRTGKTVLVVRLEDVALPSKADLPADCELPKLHDLQNLPLRAMADYAADFARLCRTLERELSGDLKPRTGAIGPWQVPTPVPDFTGRVKEFEAMAGALAHGGTVMIAAARGIGGAGKTELAKAVAARVRDSFPAGQLFVDLRGVSDNPTTPADALRQVILTFKPESRLPDTVDELLPLYRTTLANAGPVLVVLDNAKDRAQVKDLVTVPPPVGFVVTSRAAIRLDGVKPVELDRLAPDEARAMLRGIIGPDCGTDADLDDLAGLAAGLPLALRVAGNVLLNDPIETVPEYLAKLGVERLKWLNDDETDVMTVLGYSAGQLIRENAGRAERWQMLSVFPADFDEPAAAAVMGVAADAARPDLKDLLARGLVQFDDKARRFRLHDLLRLVAERAFETVPGHASAAGAGERLEDAGQRFAEQYCNVLGEAENRYRQGGTGVTEGLDRFDREKANILAGHEWAVRYQANPAAAKLVAEYPNTGAYVVHLRLSARDRIVWLLAQLDVCRELDDLSGEGTALGNLGLAYSTIGRMEDAIKHHRQSLVISRKIGDRRGESASLGNLANVYKNLGRLEDAVEHHLQRLTIAREIGDRRGEGNAFGGLGLAYQSLGRVEDAIEHHRQYLDIAREIGDRLGEGKALGNLGNAFVSLGRVKDAIKHYRQYLDIAHEIGDRQGKANAIGGLGLAYSDLGQMENAIEHCRQYLDITREIGDRRGEGNALGNLGLVYSDLGQMENAIEHYRQSLNVAREIGDRRLEGNALGNLGNECKILGRMEEAIEYTRQRLTIAREIGDRRGEAEGNWNLGLTFVKQSRYAEAIPLAERSLAYFEEIGHPHAEMIRKTLAEWRAAEKASREKDGVEQPEG